MRNIKTRIDKLSNKKEIIHSELEKNAKEVLMLLLINKRREITDDRIELFNLYCKININPNNLVYRIKQYNNTN